MNIIKATCYLNKNKSGKDINLLIKNFENLKAIKKKEITDKSYSHTLKEKIEIIKEAISQYYF